MRWQVGDATITRVREIETSVPAGGMFPDSDPSVFQANEQWLRPHFVNDDGSLVLSIHAFVVQSKGQTIVVDTCLGSRPIPGYDDLSHLQTAFLDDFAAAGFDTAAVDVVVCTHLHFDHVGWNTRLVDGEWVPTFPNARYLFGQVEYDHWKAGAEGPAVTFQDAVQPVVEAGLVTLVDMDHRVNDEVRLEPTPGHSPGHVSVHITSAGHEAVITGDMVHHPVQFAAPHWRMVVDGDVEQAKSTRTAFRDRYVDSGVRLFGTHFGGPSTGRLTRDGESYRFEV